MENIIIVLIMLCIIGGACFYIYKAKKRSGTCIGCPCAKQCGGKCGCSKDKTEINK